eukprot:TRINITY_DN10146_c0_g1_i1.p1 TRINITY_DN10146_c0_g1~~TRINITY_DN10146_c0_g1_i1.p1  ORF type:complete len:846 (-),score=287.18 TRINITY_DN10146_c0_g1_i1:279-2540(-)
MEFASDLRLPESSSAAVLDEGLSGAQQNFRSIVEALVDGGLLECFAHVEQTTGYQFADVPHRASNAKTKPKPVPAPASPPRARPPPARTTAPVPAARRVSSDAAALAAGRAKKAKLGGVRKPRASKDVKTLLSPESPLINADLAKIFSFQAWNMLSPETKDELLELLPKCDKRSAKSVEDMFFSSCFKSCFRNFQSKLACGDLDSDTNDYKKFLEGQRRRKAMDPWKEKNYEEWYGQKYVPKPIEPDEPDFKPFSFVEWHKTHPPTEAASSLVVVLEPEKTPKKKKSEPSPATVAAKSKRAAEEQAAAERLAEKKEAERAKLQQKKEQAAIQKLMQERRKAEEAERRKEAQERRKAEEAERLERRKEEARLRDEQLRIENERRAEKQRLDAEKRALEREKRREEQRAQQLLQQQRAEKLIRLRALMAERRQRQDARRIREAERARLAREEAERKRALWADRKAMKLPLAYRRPNNRRLKDFFCQLRQQDSLEAYVEASSQPLSMVKFELDIGPRVPLLDNLDELHVHDDEDDVPDCLQLRSTTSFIEEGSVINGFEVEFGSDSDSPPTPPPPSAPEPEEDAEPDVAIALDEFEDVLHELTPEERQELSVPSATPPARRVYEERVRKPSLKRQSAETPDDTPDARADSKRKRRSVGFRAAALRVLTKVGTPMNGLDIVKMALDEGLISSEGKTPQNTMIAQLNNDIHMNGDASSFTKPAPNTYGLRVWAANKPSPYRLTPGLFVKRKKSRLLPC